MAPEEGVPCDQRSSYLQNRLLLRGRGGVHQKVDQSAERYLREEFLAFLDHFAGAPVQVILQDASPFTRRAKRTNDCDTVPTWRSTSPRLRSLG